MSVVAKFYVTSKTEYASPKGSGSVTLAPVHQYDLKKTPGVCLQQCEENKIFGDATPSGEIRMSIMNPAAFEQFKPGLSYRILFEAAEEFNPSH